MPNPRLAGRYAKSLIDLAIEKNQLESVYKDMMYLQAICKNNRDFVNVLRSPIIQGDKKEKIIAAVTEGKVGNITALFNKLLVNKGRENILPEISAAFIEQYNAIKGIYKVKLTTAAVLTDDTSQSLLAKIKQETRLQNIELETTVKPEIIGGFMLEFNNNLVDASILRDLKDIQKQFQQNVYIPNIR
jgi:F-type H+-transporting ATPase subunit delta